MKVLLEEVHEDENVMEESIQKSIEKYTKKATAGGARGPQHHDPNTHDTNHGAEGKDSLTKIHGEPQSPVPPDDNTGNAVLVKAELQ